MEKGKGLLPLSERESGQVEKGKKKTLLSNYCHLPGTRMEGKRERDSHVSRKNAVFEGGVSGLGGRGAGREIHLTELLFSLRRHTTAACREKKNFSRTTI